MSVSLSGVPGRVAVEPRAVRAVVRAAAAAAYRAPIGDVRARVDEAGGGYDVRVETPLGHTDEPLLPAATDARSRLQARTAAVAGIDVATVEVRVTGVLGASRLR